MNAASVQKIIRVDDHRTSGFTGNMLAKYCHHNVAYLTRKYGGKHVSGFTIRKLSGGYLGLHHSIWKTPEGKYVEVTRKDPAASQDYFAIISEVNYGQNFSIPSNIYMKGGKCTHFDSGEDWDPSLENRSLTIREGCLLLKIFTDRASGNDDAFIEEEYMQKTDAIRKTCSKSVSMGQHVRHK